MEIIVFTTYYQVRRKRGDHRLRDLLPVGEGPSLLALPPSPPFPPHWQSLLVAAVPGMDDLGSSERWNDFILCVEMALFAAMHMKVGGQQPWLKLGGEGG